MPMSLPEDLVEQARRDRENQYLTPITSEIDRLVKEGFGGLEKVAQGAAQQVAPFTQLLSGGEIKIPTLDELTPEWMRPKPQQQSATAAPMTAPQAAAGQPAAMPTGEPKAATAPSAPRPMSAPTAGGNHGEIDNSSRQAFVRTAWPYMLQAAGGNQDAAEMMLAAAISENGDVGKGGGFIGNNFFGIKGQGTAGSFNAATWEQEGGQRVNQNADFAAYNNPVEGFGAFFDFLRNNSRYHGALARYEQTGDASQLFQDVNAAGYATDPNWASTVRSIRDTQVAPIVRGAAGEMSRVSLTAAPASSPAPGAAAPEAAGVPPAPAASPPSPWANEQATGGLMMKDSGTEDFLPGDGGYAPTPYEQPFNPDDGAREMGYTAPGLQPGGGVTNAWGQATASTPQTAPTDPDQGPREATPGSVGSQPLPQTPNPMTYGPIEQGPVAEGPPTLGDITYQNGGEPTGNGPWTEMPVRPLEAQQPESPQFSEASMPDIASGLKPVWDAAGQVIGYVQGAVSNVVQQAQSNMAQNRRNAEDANRATGYGQVSSTPGEPDYVPPTTSPLTWATNTLGEAISTFAPPAGGAPQQMDRMQAIEQQAAEWLGVDGSGMQGIAVRKRAVADPRWRAAQPALAAEYDDLQRDFGLNVMGSVGDAAKFDAAARTAGRAASQGATRAAGQEAVNVAENMVPQSNAARVAAADARMAETGSTATGMAVGPTPGVRSAASMPPIAEQPLNISSAADVVEEIKRTGMTTPARMVEMIGDRPEYLADVANVILEQRRKVVNGQLTSRDVAKAYYMTVASQGGDAISVPIIERKVPGFRIPEQFWSETRGPGGAPMVRPEEAAAAWLFSPRGQQALDDIERGIVNSEAWQEGVAVRKAWGDDRFHTTNVFSTRAPVNGRTQFNMDSVGAFTQGFNDIAARVARGEASIADMDAYVRRLNGVQMAKSPFIMHALGFGEMPTADAVEINAWLTGVADSSRLQTREAQLVKSVNEWLRDKRVGAEMRDQITARMAEMKRLLPAEATADLPDEVFNHVLHHWIWDRLKGISTTHEGFYNALRNALTIGPSPGPRNAGMGTQLATDAGNALMGSMVGAIAPADSNEERLRNTALGAAGFPLLGRGMRRAGGALGSFGPVPNGGGRPIRQTVETLQDELDGMRSLIQRARQAGDAALEKRAIDRAWELESALVDARNARLDLEPRITSDVGRRMDELPLTEESASDFAGIGRERVSPSAAADLTEPSAVATDMSGRMNSALPGFDPASAAAGGAAGAMSEDDQGNSGDPMRTAAGIGLGMLGSRMVRKPGHTVATGLKPGQRYEFRVRVVPLRDLITSHLDNLAVNRAFPGALQPRVRDRAASRVQIDKMVQAFDPEQVLMDTHRVDSGPMIVGPDMVVESGNGRGIALRRLAQENPEAYAQYVQALREELPYYGLTDDALQGIDQPVLVRERITPLDDAERARFASEANAPTAAQMSSMEQALADARSIGDGPLGRIVVGEDQTIDEALLSPENGAFVRAFMATVPDTERGKMLEANGNLSVTGLARVKAALLARTYPGAAGERVATAIVESTDAGLRNVQNAVMGSLPSMARVEGLIASGDVDGSLSLAADVAAAVDVYARLKRAGILVGDYLQQAGMFGGRETTPLQDAILGYLNDNARAPRRLRALLEGYAREVDEVAGAAGDMFGGPATAATKEELLDGVLRRLGAAPGADQGADLGRTGAGSNVVEGAGARQLAVPPADTGAQAGRGAGSPSLIDEVNAAETLTPEEQIARLQAENDRLRAERRGGGRRQQAQQPDPLQGANLPPVADDLIPSTGGEAGRLQMEGAPQPAPRPDPIPDIAPRTGGPEGTLAREGAPEPMPRPTPIPRDVLPSTGGEAGTLAQEGAPPTPARPLEEVVREIVGDGASRPAPVESPPGLNIRRLAKGIQLAAANPSPQIGLPGFPAPPPQAKPSWWDLAQTWRYSMGLFGQLSTALVQGLGGVAEVGLGAPSELIRQAVLRGHPEHVPLIIGEALKSVPRGAKEFGTTAMGRVPATIMAGSDYRPPLSDQLTGGARTAARLIETPGRVATQAPDAFWYEVFYRTGLAQAAAEQATRKGASRLDPVGSYRMQQELIENPTAEMIDRAHEFARSSTYKGELGSVAKAIGKVFRGPENPTSGLGKAWKEVGSFLMPVYHTIARIHEGALEYVPGIGALPLEAAGLAAKGRPLDQKIAQQAVGMAVAGSMLAYAAAGNVRGPGPNDPEKLKQMRDQGYEPNTTNVGGYWVPNAYFGRYGPILNAIGAMNDAVVYGDGQEKWNGARWDRQVKMVAKNFGRAFNDYPTAQAVSTLIKIKDDPVGALAEFAGGTAAQYVPAAYRSYATATDERVRRPERGKDVSPEQRFADTFAQRSGVGRQSLPEAQDVLGRPVENQRQGANVLFPRVGSDRPDRVIEAFQRVGVDIPKPADAFSIRNMVPESQRPPGSPSSFSVALTPEEQREWNTLRGQELIKQTEILLARRGWAEKPPAQRQADLNAALDAARRAADSAMQSKLGAREVNERIRSGLQKKAS